MDQPAPKGSGVEILPLVVVDLEARRVKGMKTYGEPLKAHNGRNALWDAYEEALDLACYLRQAIEESKKDGPRLRVSPHDHLFREDDTECQMTENAKRLQKFTAG